MTENLAVFLFHFGSLLAGRPVHLFRGVAGARLFRPRSNSDRDFSS
jgi:hypothetical protein